jgi:hypothetical protein
MQEMEIHAPSDPGPSNPPTTYGNYTLDSHLNCAMVPSLGIAQIGLGDGENAGEDAYLLACGMA